MACEPLATDSHYKAMTERSVVGRVRTHLQCTAPDSRAPAPSIGHPIA
jgi:hypothetical protein